MKIDKFIEELCSSSPMPGGGSVAALVGSLAAALSSMAANLSDIQEPEKYSIKAMHLANVGYKYIDKDMEAFNDYIKAINISKDTKQHREDRDKAIDKAKKDCLTVPVEVARLGYYVLKLARDVSSISNPALRSDVACSATLAKACVKCSIYNILANIENEEELEDLTNNMIDIVGLDQLSSELENEILDNLYKAHTIDKIGETYNEE